MFFGSRSKVLAGGLRYGTHSPWHLRAPEKLSTFLSDLNKIVL